MNTNNAEKINFDFLTKVHDVTGDQLNVLNMMMIKTPEQIGAFINIWTKAKESSNGDKEFVARCEKNISTAYDALEKMMKITQMIVSLPGDEPIVEIKETTTATQETETKAAPLTEKKDVNAVPMGVVKTDEELAALYDQYATLNTEEINNILKTKPQLEALEMGIYLYSNGKYKAKKPKHHAVEAVRQRINNMFEHIEPAATTTEAKETKETVASESTLLAADSNNCNLEGVTSSSNSNKGQTTVAINHAEAYKDFIGKLTIDEVGSEYKKRIESGDVDGALEFATYMLSTKSYINSTPEQVWTAETIQSFLDVIIEGASNKVNAAEDATIISESTTKNASASVAQESTDSQTVASSAEQTAADAQKQTVKPVVYDIKYNDVRILVDAESNKDDATEESVKLFLKDFLTKNVGKKIETVDFEIANEDGGFNAFWDKNFAWLPKKLEAIKSKKDRLAKEAEAATNKETIITEIGAKLITENKKNIEEGKYGINKLAGDIKTLSFKQAIKIQLTEAMAWSRRLFGAAGYDSKTKTTAISPKSEPASQAKAAEKTTTIIDTNNTTGTGNSELEKELGDKTYFEDITAFYLKYESTDKKAAAFEVIVKAFTDGKVFETASDEKPKILTMAEIEVFLNAPAHVEAKPTETTSVETKETTAAAENKETQTEQVAKPENSTTEENPFLQAKNKEQFNKAVEALAKELKDKGTKVSEISSIIKNKIVEAKREKTSFVRSKYSKAKDPTIYKDINTICIDAKIDGFMNS